MTRSCLLVLGCVVCAAAIVACSSSGGAQPAGPPEREDAGGGGGRAPSDTPGAPASVTPQAPVVTSVRVHYATSASSPGSLALRGSAAPLAWDASVVVAATSPGLYTWSSADVKTDLELKPLLGETWSRGPNYHVRPGQTVDVYPRFVAQRGSVANAYPAFTSQKLPSTRGIWVYLPPTYLENTEARFGVLYMQDAQNLFSASTAFGGHEWQVDETMDAASEDGSIAETIVVGIENTAARIDELTPVPDPDYGGGKADQYLAMIATEIKPMIDGDLRTLPAREQTGVMGSSLGGLFSTYAGVHEADVFGLVGAMSPSTWWSSTEILGEVSSLSTRPVKPLRVYVDSGDAGTSDDDVANTTELAARFRSVGYTDAKDLLHVVQPGAEHSEIYWAERLPAALHFLLGPRPN